MNKKVIVFGGGCFWCTEAVFKMLKGVLSVTPGYAGGTTKDPSYEDVSAHKTGHAEVVRIEYDADIMPLHDLLTVFFATHDPTTPNRQGNDVGEQYRSIILYTDEEQKKEAEAFIEKLNGSMEEGEPIITAIQPLDAFYEAEDYHKDYFEKNPQNPYCQIVINPKLDKVQKEFAELVKENE
ncbi:MAG: peptide-methionine (S)-S-oxide reductase [Candidatus Niyogibacteria bacterium CG10_big_fil_rev_8_21_14_0_10_46_36]|uniref:Peptide methionine sulfoxide reductase MsrA n=1 Tax=Candidatus Niyogibacteria bacterium CG10_big_fil_rev_8_21_14_0_10_46_36 TaxID=1974726 RepID=A0A2H0TCU0_9BACT|nr:MAG: peptide-methionine (S)-S-oxide reductase [Candidatus Niyogibacteria bacterium CG10_big_fil_rev_8_21_14_0_10_46_36]